MMGERLSSLESSGRVSREPAFMHTPPLRYDPLLTLAILSITVFSSCSSQHAPDKKIIRLIILHRLLLLRRLHVQFTPDSLPSLFLNSSITSQIAFLPFSSPLLSSPPLPLQQCLSIIIPLLLPLNQHPIYSTLLPFSTDFHILSSLQSI